MQVIKARTENIDVILEIIDQARSIMRETGNATQWTNGYPSREVIAGDIENDEAFVCLSENKIVGYFCFMQGKDVDPNYLVIENGQWLNDKPYGVIHRLASGKTAKGIAHAAFEFAFSQNKNIRVDTHHDNVPMQNYLRKIGFSYCGIIYVSDGTPRDAYQKDIS